MFITHTLSKCLCVCVHIGLGLCVCAECVLGTRSIVCVYVLVLCSSHITRMLFLASFSSCDTMKLMCVRACARVYVCVRVLQSCSLSEMNNMSWNLSVS